jgi:hypothetical protein
MKTLFAHLKEILQENKEDLLYLLFVGVPAVIILILLSPFMDYSNLY